MRKSFFLTFFLLSMYFLEPNIDVGLTTHANVSIIVTIPLFFIFQNGK